MKTHTLYKLTDSEGYTRRGEANETLWQPGYIYSATGRQDQDLCSDGWLHAYAHPLTAAFMNPTHANIHNPVLWRARGYGILKNDRGLKCGVRHMQLLARVPLPELSGEVRIHVAIICAQRVCSNPTWNAWANNWLNGTDRTYTSAADASDSASDSAAAASDSAADAAASDSAAYAYAYATSAYAYAADSASAAAYAAAASADSADSSLNLPVLIRQAIRAEKQLDKRK